MQDDKSVLVHYWGEITRYAVCVSLLSSNRQIADDNSLTQYFFNPKAFFAKSLSGRDACSRNTSMIPYVSFCDVS